MCVCFSSWWTRSCGSDIDVATCFLPDCMWPTTLWLMAAGTTSLWRSTAQPLRLTIDASHSNSVVLPQPCRLSQSGGALVLASSNPSTDAERLGFTGCLESVQFNGEAVRGEEGTTGTGPQTGRLFGIYQCCSDVKLCASNPCENGGTCVEEPSAGGKAMLL